MVVGELPDDLTDSDRERWLQTILGGTQGRDSVLVAVARGYGLSLRDGDHAWARAAVRACADGPRLLGVHVITLDGSREVPVPGCPPART